MAEFDPWLLLPKPVRELPVDLAAVTVLVLLTDFTVLAPVIRETSLRIILGIPLILFLPGYAFIAALFPEHSRSPASDPDEAGSEAGSSSIRDRGIDGIERIALSFGLSIAIVPLIGLVLNFTPWGIRLLPILFSISGFTLITVAVAARRRQELPPDERFSVPYRAWVDAMKTEFLEPETRKDAVLNILLAMSVVLAMASVAYAIAVPKQGEAFTEFYILTENDDGELIAADYPTEFVRGENHPVVIGVGNHEHQPLNYTIVIELQRVRIANNSTTTIEEQRLDQLRTRIASNETWTTTYQITPTITGNRLRLAFLLYIGEPPADPTVDNAYRDLHLWINVSSQENLDQPAKAATVHAEEEVETDGRSRGRLS